MYTEEDDNLASDVRFRGRSGIGPQTITQRARVGPNVARGAVRRKKLLSAQRPYRKKYIHTIYIYRYNPALAAKTNSSSVREREGALTPAAMWFAESREREGERAR